MTTSGRRLLALAITSLGFFTACPYSDTDPPAAPVFARAGEGTLKSRLPTITLEGTAEYGAKLVLTSDQAFGGMEAPAEKIADAYTARFSFPAVGLKPGKNVFTLVATDEANNASPAAKVEVEYVDEPGAVELELSSTLVTAGDATAAGALRASARIIPGIEGFRVADRLIVFELGGAGTGTFEATTDARGRAEFAFPAFERAGAGTVTASFEATGGPADTRSFLVSGGAAAGLKLELAKAGGTTFGSTLTLAAGEEADAKIVVKDGQDNVLPAPVALFTDAPGAVVSGLRIIKLNVAGTYRVVAAVSGAPTEGGGAVSGFATLVVKAGSTLAVTLTAPATATAGEPLTFRTSVSDTFGNAVTLDGSRTLTVAAQGDPDAVVTNATSTVVFRKAATSKLVATLNGGAAPLMAEASVAVSPGAPATVALAFSGTSERQTPVWEIKAASDAAITTVATVKDAFGNTVPVAVRLSTTASGTLEGTTLRGLTRAGNYEIRAEVVNALVGTRRFFNVIAGSTTTNTLELSSQLTEAGTAITYVTHSLDAFGNEAERGTALEVDALAATEWTVDSAAHTLVVRRAQDLAYVVRARPVSGNTAAAASLPLTVRAAAATTLTIDVGGANAYVAGETPALTLTAKDVFANPLANPPLTVSIVPGANTVVASPGPVFSAGKIYNLLRPGSYRVAAQVAGTSVVNNPADTEATFTVSPAASTSIVLTLARASADVGSPVDFEVSVLDAFGNKTSDAVPVNVLQGATIVATNVPRTWTATTAGTFVFEARVAAVVPNLVARRTLVVTTPLDTTGPVITFTRPANDPTIATWDAANVVAMAGCSAPAIGDSIQATASDPSLVSDAWLRVSGAATQLGAAPVIAMPASTYTPSSGVCAVPSSYAGATPPKPLVRGEVLVEFGATDLKGNYGSATGSWCVDPTVSSYVPANPPVTRCAPVKGDTTLVNAYVLAANGAGDLAVAREDGTGLAFVHLFNRSDAYGLGTAHVVKLDGTGLSSPRGLALLGRTAFTSVISTPKAFVMRTSALDAVGAGTDDAFVDLAAASDRLEGLAFGADGSLYALQVPRATTGVAAFQSKLYKFDEPMNPLKKHVALPTTAVANSATLRLTGLCAGASAGEFFATGQVDAATPKAVIAKISGSVVTTLFTDAVAGRTFGGCAWTGQGVAVGIGKKDATPGSVVLLDTATNTLGAALLTGYAATGADLDKPFGVARAGTYLFAASTEAGAGSLLRFARAGGF